MVNVNMPIPDEEEEKKQEGKEERKRHAGEGEDGGTAEGGTQGSKRSKRRKTMVEKKIGHTVYQSHMGGVDRADHQLSSFRPGSQAKRWWVVLAWHIINLSVHNAYIVHKLNHAAAGTKSMTNNKLRLMLAEQLVNGWTCRKRAGRSSLQPSTATHQRVVLDKRHDCSNCSSRAKGNKRVQTHFGCSTCKVPLCLRCHMAHRSEQ
jgi:hypothetical protein